MKNFKQWLEDGMLPQTPSAAQPNTGPQVPPSMLQMPQNPQQLPQDPQMAQQMMMYKNIQTDLSTLSNTMKTLKDPGLRNKLGQWITQMYRVN